MKKIVLFILALILCVNHVSVLLYAEETYETISEVYINPLYEDVLDEKDLQTDRRRKASLQGAKDGTVYTSYDDAVGAIKEFLLWRRMIK